MARIEQDELGELLSAYVDGELSNDETLVVEKLLREDATARHLLEQLSRTVEATRSLPRHPAPASLAGDVQAMLERSALLDDAPRPPIKIHHERAPWAARLSIAAMVGLVVVGGWYFLQDSSKKGLQSQPVLLTSTESVDSTNLSALKAVVGGRENALATADRRNLDEKLTAGVSLDALRSHVFDAEGLRLQLNVKDAKEADALVERVSRKLSQEKVANLATKSDAGSASQAGFYLRGSPGKNFEAVGESQVLVRATPTQIEQILGEVAAVKPADSDATLVAGPLKVRGMAKSQQVFSATQQMQVAADSSIARQETSARREKKATPSNDLIKGIVEIIGLDASMLESGEKIADARSQEKDEESDRAAGFAATASTERRSAEPTGKLVDQNLKRLAQPSEPSVDEPLVTMVIQLIPPPPPAPPPSPPIKQNGARRSNNSNTGR